MVVSALAAEAVDFIGGHGAEVVVQGIAGFELLAVDEERMRPATLVAMLVVVGKEGELPRNERWWCRLLSRMKPEM